MAYLGQLLQVDVDVHGKIADLVDDKHLVLGQDPALVRQAVLKWAFLSCSISWWQLM